MIIRSAEESGHLGSNAHNRVCGIRVVETAPLVTHVIEDLGARITLIERPWVTGARFGAGQQVTFLDAMTTNRSRF